MMDVNEKHAVRLQAVRTIDAAENKAAVRRAVAKAARVTLRTISTWERRYRDGELRPRPLGRKPDEVPRETRQGVIATLVKLGPFAGVNTIRGLFSDVPYRTITNMKKRLARVLRRRPGWRRRRLEWLRTGAVWAMDFTMPKARLGKGMKRLLVVVDLSSGMRLSIVECSGERARVAVATLVALFVLFGVPLAIKHDNGGAFTADVTQELLDDRNVTSMPSPVRTPQYNGGVERNIGCTKERTADIADMAGHPEEWSQADIDHARDLANHTLRPWGARGPTPIVRFAERTPITTSERAAFQRTWRARDQAALMTHVEEMGTMPSNMEQRSIRRKAIQNALCDLAYLKIRRGRISTPNSV